MNFSRIKAIFFRQFYLLRHNPTRLVNIFLWVFLDLMLWGFITKYLDVVGQSSFSFTTVFLGAIILWGFLTRSQQGFMLGFFEDVWSRNFFNYFASPLKIKEYLTGLVLAGIITSSLGFSAMVLAAGLVFGFNLFKIGIYLFPFLFILFLFGLALGIFAAGLVLRFGPSAEWLAWPIPFIIEPFVGVFYPISILPMPFQLMAKLVPLSYVFESMRTILITGEPGGDLFFSMATGLALSLIYLFSAYFFFSRIYRSVLRKGLISRINADF